MVPGQPGKQRMIGSDQVMGPGRRQRNPRALDQIEQAADRPASLTPVPPRISGRCAALALSRPGTAPIEPANRRPAKARRRDQQLLGRRLDIQWDVEPDRSRPARYRIGECLRQGLTEVTAARMSLAYLQTGEAMAMVGPS